VAALAQYLGEKESDLEPAVADKAPLGQNEPIAVVGMACRFPGAQDLDAFWEMLQSGVDAIGEVPAQRWGKAAFYHPDAATPGKAVSYWGGFLGDIDQFDAPFFGISPKEAKYLDPQQRLLLELSYEALDDAGKVRSDLDGSRTGVFVGISINEYSHLQVGNLHQITSHSGTGNALSIAANRISYFYNLRGPSLAVDTACSSSLSAVHLACQSLRSGECSTALVGGVNMILSPAHSIAFSKAGVLAPDGRCKTFDARANGYVRGEGGGMVVLKPLSVALQDGDPIRAVLLGSAMAQDGRTNGLMAPSQESQEALLKSAYQNAGINAGSVHYVEAHGTGTLLGDSMEAKALGAVVGKDRSGSPACAIGSVKTNIGHLEA
ncbi:MAG: polyketide synthase, partial [Phaeodactylibacter sp.]|nr:polyketide synthase [Phaeodactylibacter sp.]